MQPLKAKIPSSGEMLARVGLGTYKTFDVIGNPQVERDLKQILTAFVASGGSLIDSSPMYGLAEEVVGTLSHETNTNQKLFVATKVWTTGRAQGEREIQSSIQKLRRTKLDLLQIHNLIDWRTHLKTLRALKDRGSIRYIGITHYTPHAFGEMEKILKSEQIDFIQIPYSIVERTAEDRLIPIAATLGVAVIANEPFAKGGIFKKAHGRKLPAWAADMGIHSWSQYFLKFILANPAIQFVIPATRNPAHLADNMLAATGKLPDLNQRAKMLSEF